MPLEMENMQKAPVSQYRHVKIQQNSSLGEMSGKVGHQVPSRLQDLISKTL